MARPKAHKTHPAYSIITAQGTQAGQAHTLTQAQEVIAGLHLWYEAMIKQGHLSVEPLLSIVKK